MTDIIRKAFEDTLEKCGDNDKDPAVIRQACYAYFIHGWNAASSLPKSMSFEQFRNQCVDACMRATPNKTLRRGIGEAAHYIACRDAIMGLPLPLEAPVTAEVVLHQYRQRLSDGFNNGFTTWSEWSNCSAEDYADYAKAPLINDREYEVRALCVAAPQPEPVGTETATPFIIEQPLSAMPSQVNAEPYGWIQCIDGVKTNNFARTSTELANLREVRALLCPKATESYIPLVTQEALSAMEARKDEAYWERTQLVAALTKCFPAGIAKTAIEGWSEDWHGCVYIDLPTGQVSWHYQDSQAKLFANLPAYASEWDGHSTEEKYLRLEKLELADKQVLNAELSVLRDEVTRLAAMRNQPDILDFLKGVQLMDMHRRAFGSSLDSPPTTTSETDVLNAEIAALREEVTRLTQLINTPEINAFLKGVQLESAHQRDKWGASHDEGKSPGDWFWLIGYLAQKAMMAQIAGDAEKGLHHTVTTAAALANWHLAILGKTTMRPGISTPSVWR